MNAISVYEVRGEWVMYCELHDVQTICPDWELAYEAAAGHACMEHPKAEPHFVSSWVSTCLHDWMLRPESDTRECLICGDER